MTNSSTSPPSFGAGVLDLGHSKCIGSCSFNLHFLGARTILGQGLLTIFSCFPEEIAQCLRVAAVPEDPGSIPSTHIVAHNHL